MGNVEWIPFGPTDEPADQSAFERLLEQPAQEGAAKTFQTTRVPFPVVGVFHGFDLDDSPLIILPSVLPGEILTARTAVPLERDQVDAEVVVICEEGDPHRPIVMGVLERRSGVGSPAKAKGTMIVADDERYIISAKREIVLRCGDSSITLTRAGKVIIKGNYILSRATGYNKIKGAAVDIN
jgi:hypothetical protein